jgi:hypothetical protein
VLELISSYSAVGCNMSLKLNFPYSHWNFFPENMGAVSGKHGEGFHHKSSQTENRQDGKWSPNMLADCCCSLIIMSPTGENKKQKKTKCGFN